MAGAGKSALLTHLGWWWRSTGLVDKVFRFSYEDRAWTCAQLVREIAAELQNPDGHGRADNMTSEDRLELVTYHLRSRRHLLILDNTELVTSPASSPHALSAKEQANLRGLLDRLRGGATLVLLGSRGPQAWLELGEASPGTYTLDGLDPDAASMLVQRILARQGATVDLWDEAERRALEDLVIALGRYPLLMTVVLPALPAASPSEILAELRAGHSTADPGGLLRRALEYSHDRLPAPLRQSLELLAPFEAVIPTGNPLAYYERLVRGEEEAQAPEAAAANLAAAVSQAMREGLAAPHAQMQTKVQIHPSLPYFLRNRLRGRPAVLASTQSAHYEFYCGIASTIREFILSADDPGRRTVGLASARAEYANLTAALNYGLLRGRPVGALVYALSTFLDQTQQHEAQDQLLEGAIRASHNAPTPQPAPELAQLHLNAGDAALAQHHASQARTHYDSAIALLREASLHGKAGFAYLQLGKAAQEEGKPDDAHRHFDRALELCRADNDDKGAATAHRQLGTIAAQQRQFADAEANHRQALKILQAMGNLHEAAGVHHQLARTFEDQRMFPQARAEYKKAWELFRQFSNSRGIAAVCHNLGNIYLEQGQLDMAEARYHDALDNYLAVNNKDGAGAIYHQLSRVLQAQERWAEAESSIRQALDISSELHLDDSSAKAYSQLGILARIQGRADEAIGYQSQAIDLFLSVGDRYNAGRAYFNCGAAAKDAGQLTLAEDSFDRALGLFLDHDDRGAAAQTHRALGSVARDQQRWDEAREQYRQALNLYREFDLESAAYVKMTCTGCGR